VFGLIVKFGRLLSLQRRWVLPLSDAVTAAACLVIALLLRFEGNPTAKDIRPLLAWIGLLAVARIATSIGFRVNQWSFMLGGFEDGVRLAAAAASGTAVFALTLFLLQVPPPPRSVVALELFMTLGGMAAVRYSPRLAGIYLSDFRRQQRGGGTRNTLIVGAGAAGDMLLRDLQRSQEHDYHVVGFVDDNPGKRGIVLAGRSVLGSIDDLPRVAREHEVEQVLIAIPRLPAARVRQILSQCADLKLAFKILPVSFVYLQERVTASMLHDLVPEDLLPREEVQFPDAAKDLRVAGRTVLVTGAAGSIGQEICVQLLRAGVNRLVMVDLNENDMYLASRHLRRLHPDASLATEVGDIRDPGRMDALFTKHRPQDVFHAAAHKHVPLMEIAPGEAIKNNVLGTRNVALAADRAGAERFVFISTDKAVRPTSVMGASKRVAEMIVRQLARTSHTRFCAVRFGNVLGSSGSVVPLFRAQIEAGGPVTVTDPGVKRYFMTIGEAVGLVLQAGYSDYGELCVLDMGEQIKIVDLARHMITMAGHVPDADIAIEFTGLRPGEKLYEELLTEEEERTQQVDRKIFEARCPAPPDDLDGRVRELADAAAAEDEDRVRAVLRTLVRSYEPTSKARVL
jgi:FlaA1/EpsC-like NDP-sugar epimerase